MHVNLILTFEKTVLLEIPNCIYICFITFNETWYIKI